MNHLLHRIWMLLIAALAGTVLVAAPAGPALAAPGDVNVHVEDANGDPIEGVWVTYDRVDGYTQPSRRAL